MAKQRIKATKTNEFASIDPLPRMSSQRDLDLVTRVADALPPKAKIVELGPWLGALSEILATRGELHVVDTFVWTEDHNKRVPNMLNPGDSFQSVYEQLMAQRGLKVSVSQADFEAFRWSGGPIALCVIDAPKKPKAMRDALLAVLDGLNPGARLLIKNANHPKYFALMAFLQALVSRGAIAVSEADADGACNTVAFDVGLEAEALRGVLEDTPLDTEPRAALADGGLGGLGPYQLALICELIKQGVWAEAYEVLGRMQSSRRMLREWDRLEAELAKTGADPEQLAWFAEIMSLQHSKGGLPDPP
ncbi:MAG: hypothetical protein AAGF32_04270, partial [Pseudomonadota bacterium]